MPSRLKFVGHGVTQRLSRTLGPRDVLRIEDYLCAARLILAFCCFFLARTAGIELSHAWQLRGLLNIYLVYSLLAFPVLRMHGVADSAYRLTTFAVDVFFVAGVTLFSGGPYSPYGVLWAFLIIASAARWSGRETNLVAAGAGLLLMTQAWLFSVWPGFSGSTHRRSLETEPALLSATLLALIVGLLFGYLLIRSRTWQAQSALVARVLAKGCGASEVEPVIEALLEEIVPLYLPRKALLALRKPGGEEVFLWRAAAGDQFAGGVMKILAQFSELETAALCCPARSWYFDAASRKRRVPNLLAFDNAGKRMTFFDWEDWYSCLPVNLFSSLLATALPFEKPLQGCLILVDPQVGFGRKNGLRLLESLVAQISPAVQTNCRLGDISTIAQDHVRSHLSRELHDGTLQSLLSAEMQIEVLRKQRPQPATELERRLASLQALMHDEALNLRDLMEKTKPLTFSQKELPDYLAELVEKFRLESGISVRLELYQGNSTLPAKTCHEIFRIVHEGLSNVRKHSGARNVVISLSSDATGAHKLVISDDGKGFSFRGRYKQPQLEAAHRGPRVIKERVRVIGAELTIDSSPGNWAQLEINIPIQSHG
jgi:signal transduction histidine kinase